jgi:putative peptide-modifying radical SAM enzyme
MLFHVYLTRYCNLQCIYCGADPLFETIPHEPGYSNADLIKFLQNDPDPIINFYGGEPLLRINNMIDIMNLSYSTISNVKFVLQTNGLLLHKIPTDYVTKFHSILVSVDGRPEITNNYRGKDVFEKVKKNLLHIKKSCSFTGELIARMTVSRHSDIFQEVVYLLDPKNNLGFTHAHWQLDALWNSDSWENFTDWIENIYNPGLKNLINWWVGQIVDQSIIYNIIPFLGIISSLLTNSKTKLRCGAGESSYTISTDGQIMFCPICPEEPEAVVGSLDNTIDELKVVNVSEPCTTCSELDICGGRCLYTNFFKIGSNQDYETVCNSTIFLINNLRAILPIIQSVITEGKFSIQDFIYPEINNGAEIIP